MQTGSLFSKLSYNLSQSLRFSYPLLVFSFSSSLSCSPHLHLFHCFIVISFFLSSSIFLFSFLSLALFFLSLIRSCPDFSKLFKSFSLSNYLSYHLFSFHALHVFSFTHLYASLFIFLNLSLFSRFLSIDIVFTHVFFLSLCLSLSLSLSIYLSIYLFPIFHSFVPFLSLSHR